MFKNFPEVFVEPLVLRDTSLYLVASRPAYGCPPRFVGTNQNSFSWPAKQVNHMDVANKSFPETLVSPSRLRYSLYFRIKKPATCAGYSNMAVREGYTHTHPYACPFGRLRRYQLFQTISRTARLLSLPIEIFTIFQDQKTRNMCGLFKYGGEGGIRTLVRD
jgi:hypothetical protein